MSSSRSTLDQWAVLAAVVDQGGFAQAATTLHRSQSAVSYAVARLQDALDVPLLALEGRRAVLTPHGDTLLRRARALLRDARTLEQLAGSLKQGWEPQLDIVVDMAFPRQRLIAILAELERLCPHTQLKWADAVLSGAEEAITEGRADVVVTTRVPAGYLGEFLMDVTFVAIAHPGHALFRLGHVLTTDDLARHTQVVVRDSGTLKPRDEGWLGAERRCTVSSMEASFAMIAAGLAYAWLPEHIIAEGLKGGAVRPLPLTAGGSRTVSLHQVLVRGELAGRAARMASECFRRHLPITPDPATAGAHRRTP
jgi:DNA-binding transcriptional LysR family regulator